jgi:GNAT superfamily N-acetyltransferase
MIDVRPISFDGEAIRRYASLFAACFPVASRFNKAYLNWLYVSNPNGKAVGFDAWDGDVLAAHYVTIPLQGSLEGRETRFLLSLNTATHPDFQGKGLFTKLAQRTYEAATALGYGAVIGVANANSTPGFTRKLGFQLVQPLAARIGVGALGRTKATAQGQIRTSWSAEALAWRCSNPNNPVYVRERGPVVQVYAGGVGKFIHAYAELPRDRINCSSLPRPGKLLSPMRLYLGLEPGNPRSAGYVDIPQRLRPSPLNFIYRPLASGVRQLERDAVSFSFIDFDAY